MKLWHKIFLCSLALIIIAVDVTAITVLSQSYRTMVERERDKAISEHEYLTAGIANNVLYERMRQGRLLMDEEEVRKIVSAAVEESLDSRRGFAFYDDSGEIQSDRAQVLSEKTDYIETVKNGDGCYSMISDANDRSYIMVGSSMKMEGLMYYMFTISDITEIFALRDNQFLFVQRAGILFGALIGFILILVVFRLLAPLNRINRGIREIARGDYSLRLPEKGGQEFRELSGNINRMACAVEENMVRIQGIADSRKRFIDNLAHEMKTPLTSILGFSDLLRVKRTVSDEERREYAGIIVEETKRLRGLSGKLLELATTDSVNLEFEKVPIEELFAEIRSSVTLMLERRQVRFSVYSCRKTVFVDKELFKSLLYNLIDNAAKASAPGQEVRLAAAMYQEHLWITVSDDGIGMSEEDVKKAAEPFYMADKSRSRKAGGAGLGLALCAEITKRHDSELMIRSELGKGTTVAVVVPSARLGDCA